MKKAKYIWRPYAEGLREIVVDLLNTLTEKKSSKVSNGKGRQLYVSNLNRFFEYLALDKTMPKISRKELKTFMGAKIIERIPANSSLIKTLILSLQEGGNTAVRAVTKEDCIKNPTPMPKKDIL